jgi:hypothetical protein
MNRMATETSLYLRQHANNPVDWYPWGPEALARAKMLDRPIFLSVGYSACHWCHVMEHESFENAAIARLMNDHFVCIKVDREERPDVDDIYMKAVQALNRGAGGWPMSVWLTPDLRPFYAGTYYPPDDRFGRPGFPRVLTALADAWRDRRDEITRSADQITAHLLDMGRPPAASKRIDPADLTRHAAAVLRQMYDPAHGGFGGPPKFPHAIDLRLLFRAHRRDGDPELLAMARKTLDRMARGGLYDQLAGGFHRYSVDERWLVPHFEKMLYDNALLSLTYLEAFQATHDPFYCQICEETLDYVLREMTSPPGGFYSTQDADSEGEEGKFFVWTKDEVVSALGPDLADFACSVWGVTEDGNFEGKNILSRPRSDEQDAERLNLPAFTFRANLDAARRKLLAARSTRIPPGRDEKILTSWNGLMIAAFARAGAVLNRADYVTAADRAADFVLSRLRTPDGRLLRTCGADTVGKLAGYLEDYAYFADALTHLYEATFDPQRLRDAAALADVMLARFTDIDGGFFTTADDHEDLLLRPKDLHDGSTPSGNAMAVSALVRLAVFLNRPDFRHAADRTLSYYRGLLETHPTATAAMILAADFHLGPVEEVVLVGDVASQEFQSVLAAARRPFAPKRIIAARDVKSPVPADIPLLKERGSAGPVTLYVCANYACQVPVTDAKAAVQALAT